MVTVVDGCRIEIQVRTELQDLWANVMERAADRWGRELRYGGRPKSPAIGAAVSQILELSVFVDITELNEVRGDDVSATRPRIRGMLEQALAILGP